MTTTTVDCAKCGYPVELTEGRGRCWCGVVITAVPPTPAEPGPADDEYWEEVLVP